MINAPEVGGTGSLGLVLHFGISGLKDCGLDVFLVALSLRLGALGLSLGALGLSLGLGWSFCRSLVLLWVGILSSSLGEVVHLILDSWLGHCLNLALHLEQ